MPLQDFEYLDMATCDPSTSTKIKKNLYSLREPQRMYWQYVCMYVLTLVQILLCTFHCDTYVHVWI